MANNDTISVLGATTKLVGRVAGDHGLRVEGILRGDITLGGSLEVAGGANVEGDVEAESVDIAGALIGDANASDHILIRKGATMQGKVTGDRITVEPGSSVSLNLNMEFDLDL